VGSFIEDWHRIAALDDQPVLRNLLITQGYHELSHGFARMLGPENITWFGFASWSSKTVGRFLQNQQLPRMLGDWLEHVRIPTEDARLSSVSAAVLDMRSYLAKGNTEVFRELAPLFGSFLATFESDREPDPARLDRFLLALARGESAPDQVAQHPATHELELLERGGQARLGDALRHYYHAKFEPDAKRKAERILLANAHIGLHEQTRLQTYIRGALDAPVRRLLEGDAHALPSCALTTHHSSWFSLKAQNLFRRFATERVLTLSLPDSQLRLGQDLRAAPGHPLTPSLLQDIEHPELGRVLSRYAPLAELPRPVRKTGLLTRVGETCGCRRLFALDTPFTGIDAARGTCREGSLEQPPPPAARIPARVLPREQAHVAPGTGAQDWASLHQRMRFILELFRSRQRNQRLLEPTFSPAQVDVLKGGRIPHGPLT
jgi:hypothetical protein